MHVGTPKLQLLGENVRVVCPVRVAGEEREVWIGVSKEAVGLLDVGVSPFVPAATLLASLLGEELVIEPAMSALQLDGCKRASRLFSQWWGWSTPTIVATARDTDSTSRRQSTGLLFTRGIDSMSSLISSLNGGHPQVTHLVTIDGVEPRHSPMVAAQVMHDTETVAAAVDLPVVALTTNLRVELDRFVGWERTHGSVLLGVALALSPLLGQVVITPTFSDRRQQPHGSTTEIDPCWSTERTAIVTADPSLTRTGRAAIVSTRPDLMRQLKVCWQADVRGNCGRCLKCLVTMTALAIVGVSNPSEAFDAPLSIDAIRRVSKAPSLSLAEVVDDIPVEMLDLREAWLDFQAATLNAPGRRGLAGFDPAQRWKSAGGFLGPDVAVGWGPTAIAMHLERDRQDALCRQPAPVDRPLRWSVVETVSSDAARLVATLAEEWGDGGVLLVDSGVAGPAPSAVSRLLSASAMRIWWSDAGHLDGVHVLEAVEHGCVPIQVMSDDRCTLVRGHLDHRHHGLVMGESMLEHSRPSDEDLRSLWSSAVQLVVSGCLERDVMLPCA